MSCLGSKSDPEFEFNPVWSKNDILILALRTASRRNAAVYIGDSAKGAFGSGRLIAPGLILTAGHVVAHPDRRNSLAGR
jgi:hypothetical protein